MVERIVEKRSSKRWDLDPEEKANTLTHAFGLLVGLVISPFILYRAQGSPPQFWGVLVFMLSLLAVYLSSTLYHSTQSERWKFFLRKVDHICIYFLIAGTHTPFLLIYLPNSQGYTYLAILWGLVLFGIIYKLFFFGKWEWFSLTLYLGMGWMAVFTLPPMLDELPASSLHWIIFGGVAYTAGVFFYARPSLKYHHAIWHIFVLLGSAGHFMGVWQAL